MIVLVLPPSQGAQCDRDMGSDIMSSLNAADGVFNSCLTLGIIDLVESYSTVEAYEQSAASGI